MAVSFTVLKSTVWKSKYI